MAAYKTRAIVLKKTKLKETDLILTMLAENGSQIRCVAKGARKPGNSFSARLELFSEVDILLYEGKNLDTVTEARIVESNEACRSDIEHLSYGAVVAEFVEKTALEGQENPIMFPLTQTVLSSIGQSRPDMLSYMAAAYLLKAIAYLGYRPSFDECTICGESVSAFSNAQGTFNQGTFNQGTLSQGPSKQGVFLITSGGWVCPDCTAAGELESADLVDPEIVGWVKALLRLKFTEILDLLNSSDKGYAALAGELLTFCEHWLAEHLGLHLKSLGYLSRISA